MGILFELLLLLIVDDDEDAEFIVENIDVSFESRFCRRSYSGASFFAVNVGACGVRINERSSVD